LGEWLFWWLLPKNNFAREGKARHRHQPHNPTWKHLSKAHRQSRPPEMARCSRRWPRTRHPCPPASATAEEADGLAPKPLSLGVCGEAQDFGECPYSFPEGFLGRVGIFHQPTVAQRAADVY